MTAWRGGALVARVLEVCDVPAHWTRETARFASEAMQFCAFFERAHEHALPARFAIARDRLLALYAAVAGLSDVFADVPDVDATRPSTWELSNDILDVYGEVKAGLLLWQRPDVHAIRASE